MKRSRRTASTSRGNGSRHIRAPSSWSDAIAIYRNLNMGDPEATIDLLRLEAGGAHAEPENIAIWRERPPSS